MFHTKARRAMRLPYTEITPSEKDLRRFYRQTNKNGSKPDQSKQHYQGLDRCWNWLGNRRSGYGRFGIQGKSMGAYRASWLIHRGAIPEGMLVMHRCDNPRCVNPDHLQLGTHADNMADCRAKGRAGATGPKKGTKHGPRDNREINLPPVKERAKARAAMRERMHLTLTQATQTK